jgi:hypothetical protein
VTTRRPATILPSIFYPPISSPAPIVGLGFLPRVKFLAAIRATAIMNVGACIPKKKMEDFIELGTLAPKLQFNLYALGYNVEQLRQHQQSQPG